MKSVPAIAAAGWFVLASVAAASAQPFLELYDLRERVSLSGEITRVEWTGRQVVAHVMSGGQFWAVQLTPASRLNLSGLDRGNFGPGDRVTIGAHPSKSRACQPECMALGRSITFSDGLNFAVPGIEPDTRNADFIRARRLAARTAQ